MTDVQLTGSTYLPIEHYGVIGDLQTVALVGINGSIDWYCYPRFDSPSMFAAILDAARGGHFQITAVETAARHKQLYFPDTNVLITRFLSPDGVGELTDFMPLGRAEEHAARSIVRRVCVVRGTLHFRAECLPAFDYARASHETVVQSAGALFVPTAAIPDAPDLRMALRTNVPLTRYEDGVAGEFTLSAGQSASFILAPAGGTETLPPVVEGEVDQAFQTTVRFWRRWLARCTYRGRWREMVLRSALALKLLTYAPTGAIVAAPTTSLPETLGGTRNWDYRYTWIRDAAFTLYALLRIGFTEEAGQFMEWLEARTRELDPDGSLQIVYGIDGRHALPEEILPHLDGYCDSRPVRIGNAAYCQLQLDIYGELMDSVYLYNKHGSPISYDLWNNLRRLMDWLTRNWDRPDEGIWEVRGGRHQFVHSKVMSWVAFDRGLRIARQRGLPADEHTWRETRNQIYEQVVARGWSPVRRAFVQYYGSDILDASNLLMPLVKFMGPTDPRILATLDRTLEDLVSDSLVYRYDPAVCDDGLGGAREGTFSICTFWLVECLTRAGRTEEARLIMEKMFTYANHLGLFAEEIGPSGEALGNFPQAFTHLALISAAVNLDRALGHGPVT
ncbi:MAG TPA: glycoside hydrolase family 15 protein [Chloroflexota bacterium]|nr:glycoside hydrolase family 15 protein [Chloroflexota bacterium]